MLGVEVVKIGLVLVRSKCLDEHICFAPNPWIGPGSEQMHRVNRVLDKDNLQEQKYWPFYRNFDWQPLIIQNRQFHTYCINMYEIIH